MMTTNYLVTRAKKIMNCQWTKPNHMTMKAKTVLILFIVLTGCSEHKIDTKAEGDNLMQISRDWAKSAATDSIEKTLGYWADDAVIMSPGQPPLKGKKAIREMIESTSKIPGFKISWEPLSVSVSESGDLAYMIEKNQITVNDSSGKPINEFNKVVTIWRKEANGSWKNIVDMWNADPSQKK
jgi:ketosteroid isomerase-like protein